MKEAELHEGDKVLICRQQGHDRRFFSVGTVRTIYDGTINVVDVVAEDTRGIYGGRHQFYFSLSDGRQTGPAREPQLEPDLYLSSKIPKEES